MHDRSRSAEILIGNLGRSVFDVEILLVGEGVVTLCRFERIDQTGASIAFEWIRESNNHPLHSTPTRALFFSICAYRTI